MKCVAVLCLLVLTVALAAEVKTPNEEVKISNEEVKTSNEEVKTSNEEVRRTPSEDKYTDKYDNIDLDEILGNKRLTNNYYNCLMETGNCTPDGSELKLHIHEALTNECAKCSETHKRGAEKVIRHLINNEPEKWQGLKTKYDPEGTFSIKYEDQEKKLLKSGC